MHGSVGQKARARHIRESEGYFSCETNNEVMEEAPELRRRNVELLESTKEMRMSERESVFDEGTFKRASSKRLQVQGQMLRSIVLELDARRGRKQRKNERQNEIRHE